MDMTILVFARAKVPRQILGAKVATRVRRMIRPSKQEALLFLALGSLGLWLFFRIDDINPAILGDEYLYSMNSRKSLPWDSLPAGDFSNYLFNLVFQLTSLCGPNFYGCAKILNIIFFLAFLYVLFSVARKFLPLWLSLLFVIAAGLSPLSVYPSMYLPESMYLFFMALLMLQTMKAISLFSKESWIVVGVVLGLAALVKPHAWLSAIAIVVALVVFGLASSSNGPRKTLLSLAYLAVATLITRVVIGLAVGGIKAVNFFGQYVAEDTFDVVLGQGSSMEAGVASNPIETVLSLFPSQAYTHLLVVVAIMAPSLASILASVSAAIQTRRPSEPSQFSIFILIWLLTLMVQVVAFTGWITGSGDDHTTRVLLRYYEFLFVFVPLAGLIAAHSGQSTRLNVFARWGIFVALVALMTPAFTGFFANLTIQIADAPTLAGLVVNQETFNIVAVSAVASLLLFATFPRQTWLALVFVIPFTFVATGWQAQEQYLLFRGESSTADLAGQYAYLYLSPEELEETVVLATSRFDATNVAFWADSPLITYELFQPGSLLTEDQISSKKRYVITLGDLSFEGGSNIAPKGSPFEILRLNN
jgi:phosphoglycerol transferase